LRIRYVLTVIMFVPTVCYVTVCCMNVPVGLHELRCVPNVEFSFRATVEFVLLLCPYFRFVLYGVADFKRNFMPVFVDTLASIRERFLN
jgi:hypothetical protein